MPIRQGYLEIISGRRKSAVAGMVRGLLSILAVPYGLAIGVRNTFYDAGLLPAFRAAVPVICVGNISCGGTGKTPTVIALVRMLREAGHQPGILTRGYKGSAEVPADEWLLLAKALPEVPVIVGADRVASARRAVKEYKVDVLVMDDGFGHRRLGRDLDIVLLGEPLEKIRLLPRGLYREPVCSLKRADLVIHTHGQAQENELKAFRQLRRLVGLEGPIDLSALRGKKVWAFCGIGDPKAFERTLAEAGTKVVGRTDYPDHYRYSQADMDMLAAEARQAGCSWTATTMKDWVRIEHGKLSWPGGSDCRLCGLDIEMVFSEQTGKLLGEKLKALFSRG